MTAKERAYAFIKKHGDAPCAYPDGRPHASCVEELAMAFEEAMRDQRHACAEAINALDCAGVTAGHSLNVISRERAHQVVMNAEPK